MKIKPIVKPHPKKLHPESNYIKPGYIGTTFQKDGITYIIWKYTQSMTEYGQGEYDVVALLEPSKPLESVNGRLVNADANTHFSLPANKVKSVLADPSLLILRKKKIIPVRK